MTRKCNQEILSLFTGRQLQLPVRYQYVAPDCTTVAVFWLVHGMRAVNQVRLWSAHALYCWSVDGVTGASRLLCVREEFTNQTVSSEEIAEIHTPITAFLVESRTPDRSDISTNLISDT